MVVTFPARQTNSGLRPLNPNKDIPQVVELLREVFGQEVDGEGAIFGTVMDSQNPSFLWRFDPALARLSPGYVWEADNKISGNVTLIPSNPKGRYLIANVAVHPNYRRRGIARMLMNAAMRDVLNRRGREIYLQVESGNDKAISLYKSLGFDRLGEMTTWQTSVSRIRELPPNDRPPAKVQTLPGKKWKEAYQLDCQALDPNLVWPEPERSDYYKMGLWRRFFGFMNGHQIQTYVTLENDSQLSGLASIKNDWGRSHEIKMRVHPRKQGELEEALLNCAIKRVRYLARRNIRLIHNANDEVMNQLLPAANFTRQRILTHMRVQV